jgi:hypothetical protein
LLSGLIRKREGGRICLFLGPLEPYKTDDSTSIKNKDFILFLFAVIQTPAQTSASVAWLGRLGLAWSKPSQKLIGLVFGLAWFLAWLGFWLGLVFALAWFFGLAWFSGLAWSLA